MGLFDKVKDYYSMAEEGTKKALNLQSQIYTGGLWEPFPEGGGKSSSSSGGSKSALMAPAPMKLVPYGGYSNQYGVAVDLTPGEKAAESLATNLISGTEGTYRKALSGVPDYSQIDRLISIQDRDFEQQVLPDLKKTAQTGPYKNTGLAKRVEADARLSMSDQAATMRYQAYQQAKQDALNAAQILPSLTNVAGLTRNNEINNILRDMEVHYKNQGLTVQQFQMASQSFANSLALQQFEYQQYMDAENLRMQMEAANKQAQASLFGTLGGIAGAGLGLMVPGAGAAGAAIGYQLGSGIGYSVGGDRLSGQQQIGTSLGTYANYQMYQDSLRRQEKLLSGK
jgi:tetrahydrodipicolinate N-succinyltransferase